MRTQTTVAEPADTEPSERPFNARREIIGNIGFGLIAPLALFYGLRGIGVDQWMALLVGGIPPSAQTLWPVLRKGRIDAVSVFTLTILLLSVAVSFLAGSPRFLLAKDGWMTAVTGTWMLGTLPRKPFIYQFICSISTREMRERQIANRRESRTYRHVLRVATAIWGVGLVLDAIVRVVLAYSLPVDRVPLVSGLQYAVVYFLLQAVSQVYLRRKSVRTRVEAESGQRFGK